MKKEDAKRFLEDKFLCVMSSVNDQGNPESAVVAFSENEKLEILIGTSKESRKFQNIAKRPNVALVFGFDGDRSLQYEGKVRMPAEDELQERLKYHFYKQPGAKRYLNDTSQVYVIVEPVWVRLVESGPATIGELRFNS